RPTRAGASGNSRRRARPWVFLLGIALSEVVDGRLERETLALRMRLDKGERALPGVVGRRLELLLLAVEEAVRRALELDQLVLLAHRAQRLLELEVVLVRDGLVSPALQGQDRRLELRHEVDHPARPAVEADGAGEPVARGRRRPRAAAAEAEADGEDRAAAATRRLGRRGISRPGAGGFADDASSQGAQIADAGRDVGLHLLLRQLLHERHVVPVVRPLVG